MIYLYDRAICKDLEKSFNPDNVDNPVVRVFGPEDITGLVAQIKEDKINFPIVALQRDPDIRVDSDRSNFTMMHRGIRTVFDSETNEYYYEKSIPINLSYKLSVLTTNTVDMDELMRELLFKYITMYFLTITLPYECKRKVRFGIICDEDSISRKSGNIEYLKSGTLYESVLALKCEGCVLVHYTPVTLSRIEHITEIDEKS